jgi:hypothetical protein
VEPILDYAPPKKNEWQEGLRNLARNIARSSPYVFLVGIILLAMFDMNPDPLAVRHDSAQGIWFGAYLTNHPQFIIDESGDSVVIVSTGVDSESFSSVTKKDLESQGGDGVRYAIKYVIEDMSDYASKADNIDPKRLTFLIAVTGQDFGQDKAAWLQWIAKNADELKGGLDAYKKFLQIRAREKLPPGVLPSIPDSSQEYYSTYYASRYHDYWWHHWFDPLVIALSVAGMIKWHKLQTERAKLNLEKGLT